MVDTVIIPLLKIVVVIVNVALFVPIMILLERKVQGWVQSRLEPMRVGPSGLLQPFADAVKLLLKEDITPTKADQWLFTLAPILAVVPALVVFSVIPFGGDELFYITDINVGLLFTRISDLPVVPYRQDQSPRPDFWGSDVRHHTTEDDTRWVNYSPRRFSSRSTAF